jgi:hypothetical protein
MIKILMVGGALLGFGVSSAAADSYTTGNVNLGKNVTSETDFNVRSSGLYDETFSWSSLSSNFTGRGFSPLLEYTLYNAANQIVDSWAIPLTSHNLTGGAWALGPINLSAGLYYADLSTLNLSATNVQFALTTHVNPQNLPGPIAGAGIPALALAAAMLAWRRRNRQEESEIS